MRHFLVELGGFDPWLWFYKGDLNRTHEKFTQPPDHWSLFFFEHEGDVVVNNRPIPFGDGFAGFIAPGARVEFPRAGAATPTYHLTFGLLRRKETVVIPAIADLGDLKEVRRREFEESNDWLHGSIMRGLACAFNTLWSIARPPAEFRKSDLVYEAEATIMRRLSERIEIRELAKELGISHTHLLRLFRDEHACTIQEFIRERRAEVARGLICESNHSLKEICARVGMADLQAFNKLVRASTGLSPSKLREQARARARH